MNLLLTCDLSRVLFLRCMQLKLLHHLPSVRPLELPLLVGASRKGFIARMLAAGEEAVQQRQQSTHSAAATDAQAVAPINVSTEIRDWGTAATVAASILGGADIVRVHNVAAMRAVKDITDQIRRK
jgi:dihydropteroate synthase